MSPRDKCPGMVFFPARDASQGTWLEDGLKFQVGVARTFQNIELFAKMTTLDNLLLGRHVHIRTNLLACTWFSRRTMRTEIEHRERVELGRALAMEPKLLLLDEPSAGMNAEEKLDLSFRISDIRADFDVTILLVEHDMRMVMGVSDRVLAMNDGALITCGTPEQVQNHPEVLRAYLTRKPPDGRLPAPRPQADRKRHTLPGAAWRAWDRARPPPRELARAISR